MTETTSTLLTIGFISTLSGLLILLGMLISEKTNAKITDACAITCFGGIALMVLALTLELSAN